MEEAQYQLENILSQLESTVATKNGFSKRRIANKFSLGSPRSALTKSTENEPYVHVFNFENEEGFAIMSGDIGIPPLVALTSKGSISPNDTIDNPGLIIFLTNFADTCDGFELKEILPIVEPGLIILGECNIITYDKAHGKCTVKWGQDTPYNNYCPKDNGHSTKAGCAATAIAQLMSIYEWPESYNGYTFDWDIMNRHICSNRIERYEPAYDNIARLFQQLGTKDNLNTDYGINESPSSLYNIPSTLSNFGFSESGIIENYSTNNVVTELMDGNDMLFYGCSEATSKEAIDLHPFDLNLASNAYVYTNGHIWLAHGLLEARQEYLIVNEKNEIVDRFELSAWYPLCNFGWNGSADGYYLSGIFDTSDGPGYTERSINGTNSGAYGEDGNYQFNQKVITNIRK